MGSTVLQQTYLAPAALEHLRQCDLFERGAETFKELELSWDQKPKQKHNADRQDKEAV